MSESQKTEMSADKLAVWRSYFQAAITGVIAAGDLDPRNPGVAAIITESAARVADAALTQPRREHKKTGVVCSAVSKESGRHRRRSGKKAARERWGTSHLGRCSSGLADPQSDPPGNGRRAKVLDANRRNHSRNRPLASGNVHRLLPAVSS